MDRREILFALPATLAAPMALAQSAPFVTRQLNNVMIAVSDLTRSVAFYSKLFGVPVRDGDVAIFRIGRGPHFFALVQAAAGAKPDFLSYGMTVENFDAAKFAALLPGFGATDVQITDRSGTAELFLHDPSGVKMQLQAVGYGRGSGPLGDRLPPSPRASEKPAFALQTISHVTLTVGQGAKSMEFYQGAFGLPVKAHQGPTAIFQVGSGTDSVVFNPAANNPATPGGINHACFTLSDFNPNTVMGVLMENGLEPIEFGNAAAIKPMTCRVRLRQRAANGGGPTSPLGTAELYFNDPDNIPIQLQDVSYCGGSGWLGQICP